MAAMAFGRSLEEYICIMNTYFSSLVLSCFLRNVSTIIRPDLARLDLKMPGVELVPQPTCSDFPADAYVHLGLGGLAACTYSWIVWAYQSGLGCADA